MTGQTGQSELPGSVHQGRREPDQAAVAIDRCRLDGCDLLLTQALPHDVQTGGQRRIAKGRLPSHGKGETMVAVKDFSGFAISAWALASAAASTPTLSLERCTAGLHVQNFKTDGA